MKSRGGPDRPPHRFPREVFALEKALKFMENINTKICYVSMGAAFFLMCMTTVHAVLRKFTYSGGIIDSFDITNLCMVLIVFCAFAYMESQNGHVRIDILASKFPKKAGAALHGTLLVITGIFIFIMFYAVAGNIPTIYSRGAATTVFHIPHWPFYIVIAVGLFVYAVTVLLHAFEKFGQIKGIEDEPEEDGVKDVDVTTQM